MRVPSATRYVPVPCSIDVEMVRDTERWSRQTRIRPQVTLGLAWIGAAAVLTGGGWERCIWEGKRAGVAHLGEPVLRAGLAGQRDAARVLASGEGGGHPHIVKVSGREVGVPQAETERRVKIRRSTSGTSFSTSRLTSWKLEIFRAPQHVPMDLNTVAHSSTHWVKFCLLYQQRAAYIARVDCPVQKSMIWSV